MKKIIMFVFCCLLFSCSTSNLRKIASAQDLELQGRYDADLKRLEDLVEKSVSWRTESIEFYLSHQEKLKLNGHLSHEEMLSVFKWAREYLDLRKEFFYLVDKYNLNIGDNLTVKLKPSEGTRTDIYTDTVTDATFPNPPVERRRIFLDPKDAEGKELIVKLKVALTAAVVLYDNYMIGIYPYEKSWKLRRLINEDNVELKNELKKMTDSFFDLKNRIQFYQSAKIYKKVVEYQTANNYSIFSGDKYLDGIIEGSPVYHFMTTGKDLEDQPQIIRVFLDRIFDNSRFLGELFSYYGSKAFGNAVGSVTFREGKLKNMQESEKNGLKTELKTLDIMMEKTPFRLTDKFIPGHYGHVAIWIGTEAELRELGVWDNPLVEKFHQQIQSGHHIIEALRPGVQINTLDHFLDIDDLLVVRHENLTLEEKREYVLRTFEQIGKSYDFNFDVETDKKIVCSEIVYVVFHNIDWPTKKSVGRYTISPDNVAVKALPEGPLTPIIMYNDGQRVENERLQEALKKNLESK